MNKLLSTENKELKDIQLSNKNEILDVRTILEDERVHQKQLLLNLPETVVPVLVVR